MSLFKALRYVSLMRYVNNLENNDVGGGTGGADSDSTVSLLVDGVNYAVDNTSDPEAMGEGVGYTIKIN